MGGGVGVGGEAETARLARLRLPASCIFLRLRCRRCRGRGGEGEKGVGVVYTVRRLVRGPVAFWRVGDTELEKLNSNPNSRMRETGFAGPWRFVGEKEGG